MNDLLSLIGMNVVNRTRSRLYGREYSGSCPWCGCRDAFHIWPDTNDIPGVGPLGRYLCMGSKQGRNGCGESGDMLAFVQKQESLNFDEACERLGIDPQVIINYRREQQGKSPQERRAPKVKRFSSLGETEYWQTTAWAFAKAAVAQLEGEPLEYLLSRGLTKETIQRAALGFYPKYRRARVETWGYKYKDGEKPFSIKIPRGIVIPWFDSKGAVICLRFRRLPGDESEDARKFYGVDEKTGEIGRYTALYGSCSHLLYGNDKLAPDLDVVLMEGELDALTGSQAGVCACVATGSTGWCRSEETLMALGMCNQVLVSYDSDSAGERASQFWCDELGNARRWRPFWKDANAMATEGLDLTAWLHLGLGDAEEASGEDEDEFIHLESCMKVCAVCHTDIETPGMQFYYDEHRTLFCEQHWTGPLPDTQERNEDGKVVSVCSGEMYAGPVSDPGAIAPEDLLRVGQEIASAVFPGGCDVVLEPRITLQEHIKKHKISYSQNVRRLKFGQQPAKVTAKVGDMIEEAEIENLKIREYTAQELSGV